MPKLTRAEAARINGSKSKGPKTPQGRARSALNNMKHGLTGRTAVMANESPALFKSLIREYVREFKPRTRSEFDLVIDLACSRWRLRRVWSLETALMDETMEHCRQNPANFRTPVDETVRQAQAWKFLADASHALDLMNRYETRCKRHFDRTIERLRERQKQNFPFEPNVNVA